MARTINCRRSGRAIQDGRHQGGLAGNQANKAIGTYQRTDRQPAKTTEKHPQAPEDHNWSCQSGLSPELVGLTPGVSVSSDCFSACVTKYHNLLE